jgi:hypothetical protein
MDNIPAILFPNQIHLKEDVCKSFHSRCQLGRKGGEHFISENQENGDNIGIKVGRGIEEKKLVGICSNNEQSVQCASECYFNVTLSGFEELIEALSEFLFSEKSEKKTRKA